MYKLSLIFVLLIMGCESVETPYDKGKFKLGDVVTLKGENEPMVVRNLSYNSNKPEWTRYECRYKLKKTNMDGSFTSDYDIEDFYEYELQKYESKSKIEGEFSL